MSLPGWQALHEEIEPFGATVVTVALDVNPDHARPFAEAAKATHPALVDTTHATNAAFGFTNIPMAVWIDEDGNLVRPAEAASIEKAIGRDRPIPEGLPDLVVKLFEAVREIPDDGEEYRAAIVDWVKNGSSSRFALSPEQVVELSRPSSDDEARTAACFELGDHLRRTVSADAAVPWWKEAHRLDPFSLAYKRQAWTLVTTPEGADAPDLMQGPNDVYDSNLVDTVVGGGGFKAFIVRPRLDGV